MDYPRVLRSAIEIMPIKKRSVEWFNRQPDPIRRQFWYMLAKFGAVVAAEYLKSNSVVVPEIAPVAAVVIAKELNAKILKAFSKPLTVSGTVVGQMWPTGLNILLPRPCYYSYSRIADDWTHIGVVTTGNGNRSTHVSCHASIACHRTRQSARGYARAGHAIGHIKVEMLELRLEQVEMVGKYKRCA